MAEENLSLFLRIVSETIGWDAVRTVFELGARDGTETVMFEERFPAARIFTFECNPATLERCRHVVARLKNAQLVEKAVILVHSRGTGLTESGCIDTCNSHRLVRLRGNAHHPSRRRVAVLHPVAGTLSIALSGRSEC